MLTRSAVCAQGKPLSAANLLLTNLHLAATDGMEALTSALFALELPDNGQALFTQDFGKALETFHCFEKLPIETRLVVWRLCFPLPRKVNLRPGKYCQKRDNTIVSR
jgi:hypothetical protein